MSAEAPTPQTNGYNSHHAATESVASANATNGSTNGSTNGTTAAPSHSKDEIGWYFVEQYYTNLSKNPEKLHLFYAKRSQFVSGLETEKVPVHVGQRAISEGIKELNYQDAKVRITNVDAQESGRNIVTQVIGEMSNNGEPHRKFVQTFVLAEQPNGYYVLNDIFRYIADEEEDPAEEEPTEETAAPEAKPELTSNNNEREKDIDDLEKKLEETAAEPEIQPSVVAAVHNDAPAEPEPDSVEAVKEKAEEKPATPEAAAQEVEEEEQQAIEEKPKDPEPTPAPMSPVKSAATPVAAPVEPAAPLPSKPAAPKTWASMLASNKPAVAIPPASVPAATQPKSAPKAASTAAAEAISAPGAAAVVAGLADDNQAPPSPGGWQTAGQEHNRKQHKQQPSSLGGQTDSASAYIKNVTEKVDAVILKTTLGKYGKLVYFDVSRPKNCAFVEFDSPSAFQKAVSENPHIINGVEVIVAERHRAGNGYPRGGGVRGGRGGMENRTNSSGGRGGFTKDGRGNFNNRSGGGNGGAARGGGTTSQRGRGAAQAA